MRTCQLAVGMPVTHNELNLTPTQQNLTGCATHMQGANVTMLCGSHGLKAIALAKLGAVVSVVDLSEGDFGHSLPLSVSASVSKALGAGMGEGRACYCYL